MSRRQDEDEATRLTKFFYSTVGVELGLYNSSTKKMVDDHSEDPRYQSTLEATRSILKSMSPHDLRRYIQSSYEAGTRSGSIKDVIPSKRAETALQAESNLLEAGIDYQHPSLYDRNYSSFAVQGGNLITVSRGAIKRKPKFSVRDLVDYYFQRAKVANTPRHWESVMKTFIWILDHSRVDEVLTAIDYALEDDECVSAIEVNKYIGDAASIVREKEARAKEF
jgi:hypothetical protein